MQIPRSSALFFLVIANMIPIVGVLLFRWDVASIMAIYWLENVIIGLVNLPKMWACEGGLGITVFLSVFFSFHYGMFCWGHMTFLNSMFETKDILSELPSGGPIVWTAVALLLSHLFSMGVNFFGKKEYQSRNVAEQMFFPYGRIVVLHMVLLIGGLLVVTFGAPILALVLLIVLKIIMDMTAHSLEHRGKPFHTLS